jgi:hypothetical protein
MTRVREVAWNSKVQTPKAKWDERGKVQEEGKANE